MTTPIADMVERMLANNDPHIAIVAAVRALEVVRRQSADSPQLSADKRRTADRERKRAARAIYKQHKEKQATGKQTMPGTALVLLSADSPQTSADNALTDSQLDQHQLVEKNTAASIVEGQKVKSNGTRLLPNAALSDEGRRYALDHGVAPDKVWIEFRDYWIAVPGQRGRKVDWAATWRTWVRKTIERRGTANGHQQGPLQQAADDLLARLKAFGD